MVKEITIYDIGRIKLKTGELEPTGSLRITFDFFSHGAGDYFDVDSYTGVVLTMKIFLVIIQIQQVNLLN